ncbi:MAG: hypothetical protein LH660_00555 [Phormidesmis sp. CAN_BIN36]|nr:hypothetical protein [Phormidesmis sp. CAN_BIN36]
MNHQIRPHPSPLPKGEGTKLLAPFSLGRRVGDEGNSYFHSATPKTSGFQRSRYCIHQLGSKIFRPRIIVS